MQAKIVILGTGGTIAGTAPSATDSLGYTAAQIGVAQLVAAVPALAQWPIECEQVAQLDSKDMDFATWQRLAQRVQAHLERDEVQGIVITHGTDTLEETAYFLHRVLAPAKPVVLTAAMRPATSVEADGPQNLLDAVAVAGHGDVRGVCVAFAGTVFHAVGLRKVHTHRLDAFAGAEAGPLARIDGGKVSRLRDVPAVQGIGMAAISANPQAWPRVEIVFNHAGADGRIVDALLAQGIDGLVVAGTGNGSLAEPLLQAVRRAQAAGVRVSRASRCSSGPVLAARDDDRLPASGDLGAPQARVELLLQLLEAAAVAPVRSR